MPASPAPPPLPPAEYHREEFGPEETAVLVRFFTNTTEPVFALFNLPEVVKGALFARYSRTNRSLRRLFLDEFYSTPELGIAHLAAGLQGDEALRLARAEGLYEKVFTEFGDDSVAQLGSAHLACEQASNVLTKVLERGRLVQRIARWSSTISVWNSQRSKSIDQTESVYSGPPLSASFHIQELAGHWSAKSLAEMNSR